MNFNSKKRNNLQILHAVMSGNPASAKKLYKGKENNTDGGALIFMGEVKPVDEEEKETDLFTLCNFPFPELKKYAGQKLTACEAQELANQFCGVTKYKNCLLLSPVSPREK